MIIAVVGLMIGIGLLAFASDQLVIGAARIALIGRIAPLVVGVVIVGFGTSMPELLVSASAAFGGEADIAVGNIVGSNLVNLSLILGIGVLILPLSIDSGTIRREAPLTVGGMALFLLFVQNGITVLEGVVLLLAMAAVLALIIGSRRGDPLEIDTVDFAGEDHRLRTEIARTVLGLAGTLGGAQLLLVSAIDLSNRAGLSRGLVGATLVAVGTSLPELVTVVQSARRGQGDLILGNLLGSNLFNALAVAGVVGVVGGTNVHASMLTGLAAGAAVVLGAIVWGMMLTGRKLQRSEGAILLGFYAAILVLFIR